MPDSVSSSTATAGTADAGVSTPVSDLVASATDSYGSTDTGALARMVANAYQRDPDAGFDAYLEVENQLGQNNPSDVSRFNQDLHAEMACRNPAAPAVMGRPTPRGRIEPDPGYLASLQGIAQSELPLSDKLGMAWDTTQSYARTNDGLQGTMQAADGAIELLGALALNRIGLGYVVGVPLAWHAGDDISTGLNRVFGQGNGQTVANQAVQAATGSPAAAQTVDQAFRFAGATATVGLSLNLAESRALGAARTIEEEPINEETEISTRETTVNNNFYSDGSISDPAKPMSATGPWKSAAELTGADADALVNRSLPPNAQIIKTMSANAKNATEISNGWKPPHLPDSNIVQFVSPQNEPFVRLYSGGSRPAGSWVMRTRDIAGLAPQQMASKFSLPQVPTMITDVSVPAGTPLNASVANAVSPRAAEGIFTGDNVGGGGLQFEIQVPRQKLDSSWFSNERPLQ